MTPSPGTAPHPSSFFDVVGQAAVPPPLPLQSAGAVAGALALMHKTWGPLWPPPPAGTDPGRPLFSETAPVRFTPVLLVKRMAAI